MGGRGYIREDVNDVIDECNYIMQGLTGVREEKGII